MIAQANITSIVIGKDDNLASSTETRDDLIAGQIGVFKVGSKTATTSALSAGERFQIVYKRVDGALIESPVINYSHIKDKTAEGTPAAAVQNVLYIGYNGTSGSIAVSNNENYVVHYTWDDFTKSTGIGKPVKFTAYKSSASATQVEIADGLALNLNDNSKREQPYPVAIADVIINNAGAVITGTGNITAEKGSKYMTAATDADAVIAAGDYLRLGTAAGATTSDPVYKVVSVGSGAGSVIQVDRDFTGTSATYTEANCDYIASATAASAAAGVLITAGVQPFDPGKRKYAQTKIEFWLIGDGLGATDIDTLTEPSKGKGTYEEIAEIEWFLRGNRGETWRVGNYPKNYTADAISGKTYQQVVFSYMDTNARTVDRDVASFGATMIATENQSASTVHDDLKTVLGI